MPRPDWLPPQALPPLLARNGQPLSADEVATLLDWLQFEVPAPAKRTIEAPSPPQLWPRAVLPAALRERLDRLREQCAEAALDQWAAALLRAWLRDIGSGTARKIRWVVPAIGLLGGDACAALLGAHLRGENHTLRCTGETGVTALREIGTPGALLELAHLPGHRGGLAYEALKAIAEAQGLTFDQLQDRLVPDCGLDARGERVFDYGARQFSLLLDDTLKPALRAPDGRRLTTPPKPTAKDDAARAAQTRLDWKIAKVQIQQSARWLARRFEVAMITGETWQPDDFARLFRRHPLARHVVRRVLWTAHDAAAASVVRFRVAEDDTLADLNDAACDLPAGAEGVRPVHPLEIDSTELAAWQKLFADYALIGPSAQLDRRVFRPTAEEAPRKNATLPHTRVEAKALAFPLEARGWQRELGPDNGMNMRHTRHLAWAGVAACLDYEPGVFVGDIPGSGVQSLQQLFFVPMGASERAPQALPLGSIPVIAYSEVLRDLDALIPAN